MLCPPTFAPPNPIVSRNNQLANDWLGWLRHTAGRTPQTSYNYASVVAMYLDENDGLIWPHFGGVATV